jgi:hypothetical protein
VLNEEEELDNFLGEGAELAEEGLEGKRERRAAAAAAMMEGGRKEGKSEGKE